MATENTQPNPSDIKAGMFFKFLGYDGEQENPILETNEVVQVESYTPENGMVVRSFRHEQRETLFENEVVYPTQEEIDAMTGSAAASEAEGATDAPAAEAEAPKKGGKKASGKSKKQQVAAQVAENAAAAAAANDTAVSEGASGAYQALTISNNTRAVSEILAGDGESVLEAAEALLEQVEQTYFTLGGVLAHIYAEGLQKRLGYDGKRSFARYVQEKLGIEYRKAMYLIDIYTAFSKLGIPEERLAEIGWSKAKELVKVADPERADALIDYAKNHTRAELIEHIRSETVEAGDGSSSTRMRVTKFAFTVSEEAGVNIQAALDAAKNMSGSDSANTCFEYIVGEWRQMQEGIEVPVEEAIQLLEAKYGVRLVIQSDAESAEEQATASVVQ